MSADTILGDMCLLIVYKLEVMKTTKKKEETKETSLKLQELEELKRFFEGMR